MVTLGRVLAFALEGNVCGRMVDSDKPHGDRVRDLPTEMHRLATEMAPHPIDLLGIIALVHLDLRTDVYSGGWATGTTWPAYGRGVTGKHRAERAVAPSCLDPGTDPLGIEHDSTRIDVAPESAVYPKFVEVIEEVVGDAVAELGVAVEVRACSKGFLRSRPEDGTPSRSRSRDTMARGLGRSKLWQQGPSRLVVRSDCRPRPVLEAHRTPSRCRIASTYRGSTSTGRRVSSSLQGGDRSRACPCEGVQHRVTHEAEHPDQPPRDLHRIWRGVVATKLPRYVTPDRREKPTVLSGFDA